MKIKNIRIGVTKEYCKKKKGFETLLDLRMC